MQKNAFFSPFGVAHTGRNIAYFILSKIGKYERILKTFSHSLDDASHNNVATECIKTSL